MTRPPRPPKYKLLHVDDAIVVVDKPARLLTVRGRGPDASLLDELRASPRFADEEPLRVAHRLDCDTSGVVVFARTIEAQRSLSEQFAAGRVEKVYLALVTGYVAGDGEVDMPIAPTRTERMRTARPGGGKDSITRYRVLERLPGDTLLECRPTTGRTHQIRVHLAAIGHPLTVDPLYGGGIAVLLSRYKSGYVPSGRKEERPLIDRLTLHAAAISFDHPADGRRICYESPLPKDFAATLKQLRKLT